MEIGNLQTERDTFRLETKDLIQTKHALEQQKLIITTQASEKIRKLESNLKKAVEDIRSHFEARQQQEREIRKLYEERDKQKKRIQKLIARKGNFSSGIKACKNCNNEYRENENFNWSCRTHQSEWGGEMWWCCGKRGKDQPGCKFSKHESKDDAEDDEEKKRDQDEKIQRYVRCICCKEIGHSIDQCTRDPNFKTNQAANAEIDRIVKIKDFRKLHADTVVSTTHFIKKSVMVPINEDNDGNLVSNDQNTSHPFMRGIMQFDDYNYKQFNDFVLVPEPTNQKGPVRPLTK